MLDQQKTRWYWLASSFSKALPPAFVLVIVVVVAGIQGGLGVLGTAGLLTGVAIVPGLIYKRSRKVFLRYGVPDRWRTNLVAVLTLVAALVCMRLHLNPPISATVIALFFGNVGLLVLRRWLNASAHVSVLTFGILWICAVFGVGWAWLLVLSPLMMISRVELKEHTLAEVLTGALLGVATFGCFLGATTWSLVK